MVVGGRATRREASPTGTLRAVTSDPLLDPVPPTHDIAPDARPVAQRGVRPPVDGGDDLGVRQLRDPDRPAVRGDPDAPRRTDRGRRAAQPRPVAALLVGFVAGAWVDRLRRRPVLIWADLGRAVLLGSIPVAAIGGWLTLPQVFVVSALAAVLTTFFDVADRAYLPTVVGRADLVRANGALAATSSAIEFAAFGVAGFLVNLLTAPIAIAIDALSFVVSAVLLGSIRRPEPPPPPASEREPVLDEIREGLRLVVRDPVLRGLAWGTMGLAAMWGVFGATWLLFVTDDLHLDPGGHRRGRRAGRLRVAARRAARRAGRRAVRARARRASCRCCSPRSATS